MLPKPRADALAAELDIDLDCGICLLCLLFVVYELESGDGRKIGGAVTRMAPWLWQDGLEQPARAAVAAAVAAGARDAEAALADLDARGPRSSIVRAIVLRLAHDLDRRARAEERLYGAARERLAATRPELN